MFGMGTGGSLRLLSPEILYFSLSFRSFSTFKTTQESLDLSVRLISSTLSSSSTQLLNLLNNILDMSEIEMQELKLKEYQFSLTELIDNIQVVLTQMARSRKVELTIKCDIEHTNLLGDSVRLRQVLMNIISNGIKYTEAFGRVDVSIKEIESADAECAEYGFEITDTGVGMTQEFIENHIFMPFERAEDTAYINDKHNTNNCQ